MAILNISNLVFKKSGKIVCEVKELEIVGVCGVLGGENEFKKGFNSIFSSSMTHYVHGLEWSMNLKFRGKRISIKQLNKLINPFTIFNYKNTIENILFMINRKLADCVIRNFNLEELRTCPLVNLRAFESFRFEMAVAACSQSAIVFISENVDPFRTTKFFVDRLTKFLDLDKTVIFIETNIYEEFKYDSYVYIRHNSIHSIVMKSGNKHVFNNWMAEQLESIYFVRNANKNVADKHQNPRSDNCIVLKKDNGIQIVSFTLNIVFYYFCSILKSFKGLVPDFGKAVVLTNTRFNRKDEKRGIYFNYFSMGNIASLVLLLKHFCLVLKVGLVCAKYHLTSIFKRRKKVWDRKFENFCSENDIVKSKNLEKNSNVCFKASLSRTKQDYLFNPLLYDNLTLFTQIICDMVSDFAILFLYNLSMEACIFKVVRSFLSLIKMDAYVSLIDSFLRYFKLSIFPYIEKTLVTCVYIFVFSKSAVMLDTEYKSTRKCLCVVFSSSTLFLHLFMYTLFSCSLPLLIVTYILNLKYVFVCIINATIVFPCFNLIRNTKLKYSSFMFFLVFDCCFSQSAQGPKFYISCMFGLYKYLCVIKLDPNIVLVLFRKFIIFYTFFCLMMVFY